jgi:molybdate transport system ATP-binding protein
MTLRITLRQRLGAFDLDVQFAAPPGVTVLFGPSGAGKTAVLNAVAGLTRPDQGEIALPSGLVLFDSASGRCLPPHRRRLGVIFQQPRLFDHLSVRQNLTFGQRFAPRGAALPPLEAVVELLGIAHLLHRRPQALSGGEAARVAIGRALLCGPEMILADEPLAALDAPRRAEILPYFLKLRDLGGVPMLYVTHSHQEMALLATSVVALRAGRVAAIGTAAQILGRSDADGGPAALLPVQPVARHEDGLVEYASDLGRLWVPQPPPLPQAQAQALRMPLPMARTHLRIQAQDVTLALAHPGAISALNILQGTITQITPTGQGAVLVTLGEAPAQILARITQRSAEAMALRAGQKVFAIVKSLSLAAE